MLRDEVGRRILRERPRVGRGGLEGRKAEFLGGEGGKGKDGEWPKGSLGEAYEKWCRVEGVGPETRDPVRYVPAAFGGEDGMEGEGEKDRGELAYVLQRYRECHDFYHAITGLPVLVEGEVGVKMLEFANTGLPVAGLSVLAGLGLGFTKEQKRRLREVYLPWGWRSGVNGADLLNVYWEEELGTDVKVLRERLGLEEVLDLREERKRLREERRRAR